MTHVQYLRSLEVMCDIIWKEQSRIIIVDY